MKKIPANAVAAGTKVEPTVQTESGHARIFYAPWQFGSESAQQLPTIDDLVAELQAVPKTKRRELAKQNGRRFLKRESL